MRGETSQAQIARELGMKQPQYARYESGASSPSADVLIKMCDVFLCSADDILGTHRGGSQGVSVRADKGSMAVNISNNRLDGSIGPFSITSDPPPSCKKCPHLKKLKALEKLVAK